uniref:Achaete-scute family bHLH transcription factor 4 n=1 Tax=Aquila chrysaetos chrysaetos TaxID=223781 RepID=A0A663EC05_AQUCH
YTAEGNCSLRGRVPIQMFPPYDDGLLNRIAFPGAMSLANSHVHPHGVPLREPFGVPFHLDPSYWEQAYRGHAGRISYIPFPGYMGIYDYSFEPAFIRKRNERERQRVRCVNEGYTRLREHLPKEFADKRLSKVETLRAAISYIKHLQSLLDCHPLGSNSKETLSFYCLFFLTANVRCSGLQTLALGKVRFR